MKKLIILSLFAFSVSVSVSVSQASVPAVQMQMAQDFLLNSDFSSDGKVYFNCDSVESDFSSLLKALGATDVVVKCNGGIQDTHAGSWDADVSLHFTVLKEAHSKVATTQANYMQVYFHSFDNCFLFTQLFDQVKKSLDMKDLKVTQSCMTPSSPFHLQVSTLF